MPQTHEPHSELAEMWEDLTHWRTGPLHRLAGAIGLPRSPEGFVWLGIGMALLAWVPLFALTVATGTFTSGSAVPFLPSLGTHVRLLLAIPLIFVAEEIFNQRVRTGLQAIVRSKLVPAEELPRLRQALFTAIRWRDTWAIEGVLALITVGLIVKGLRVDLPGELTTWRHAPDQQQTLAGLWYGVVALPLFQFLVWRSIARVLIWGYLLWTLCRMDLRLVPTHPDLCGGLGPLGDVHVGLGPLSFALSAILVATFAEEVLYGHRDVRDAVMPLAVMVVASTCVLVAPLVLFMPKLFTAKHRGVREYGVVAASYTSAFERKWVRGTPPPSEPLLGSPDIQSLADLASSFDIVQHMRVVPIAFNQLVLLAVAALAPALPLILFVIPLEDLIIRGAQLLFPL